LQTLAHDLDTVTQAAHAASKTAREQFSSSPEEIVPSQASSRKTRYGAVSPELAGYGDASRVPTLPARMAAEHRTI
jgi:hypothetical protein